MRASRMLIGHVTAAEIGALDEYIGRCRDIALHGDAEWAGDPPSCSGTAGHQRDASSCCSCCLNARGVLLERGVRA